MSIRTLPNILSALNCALLALLSVVLMLCHNSRFNNQIIDSILVGHTSRFVEAYKDVAIATSASVNHQYNPNILFESTRLGSQEALATTTTPTISITPTGVTEVTATSRGSPRGPERKSSIPASIAASRSEEIKLPRNQNSKRPLEPESKHKALVRVKPNYTDDNLPINYHHHPNENESESSNNKSTIKPRSLQFNANTNYNYLDDDVYGIGANTSRYANIRSQNSKSLSADTVEVSETNSHIQHNSQCALILKRTYILNNPANNDEWGDKFVFNDVDTDSNKKKVQKSNLCIKHSDVDKAIEEAKHKIKFEKPDDLDSLEVSEKSISAIAELNLATGQVLIKKFDLSHDEILNALPMIDMSSSKFYWKDLCPKHVRSMTCTKSRYRTITAHCNNLKHPSWGAAKTPYSRYLPPDYADGLTLPRASQTGDQLPSARLITSIVHRDADEPSNDYSALFASWGQLLNHDVTRHAVGEGKYKLTTFMNGFMRKRVIHIILI